MAFRFNPSSNNQTEGFLNLLGTLYQQEQAKQQADEADKQQKVMLQSMGLLPPETVPNPITQPHPNTTGGLVPTSTPQAIPQGAAMSLLKGGFGDVNGRPIATPKPVSPAVTPTASPTTQSFGINKFLSPNNPIIPLPKKGGGFTFMHNPNFISPSKQASMSSISTLDMSKIKAPKTQEERQAIIDSLPSDLATNVQAAGTYNLDARTLYGLRNNSGDRAKFDALIRTLYPGWSMQKYQARQKYMNDLAAGKLSQNVTSLNTLAHHLGTFQQTMTEMQNSGVPAKNAFINAVKTISGDPTITDFNTAKEVVDNEMQRTLTGVGVTQAGIDRAGKTINQNSSYKQFNNYLNLVKQIVKGRIDPLRQQYKNNMGEDENGQILYPDSKSVFDSTSNTQTDNSGNQKDYSSLWQ